MFIGNMEGGGKGSGVAVEDRTVVVVFAAQDFRLVDRTHRVLVVFFRMRLRVVGVAGFTAALDEDVSLCSGLA